MLQLGSGYPQQHQQQRAQWDLLVLELRAAVGELLHLRSPRVNCADPNDFDADGFDADDFNADGNRHEFRHAHQRQPLSQFPVRRRNNGHRHWRRGCHRHRMPRHVPPHAMQAEEAGRACAGGHVSGRPKVYPAGTGVSGIFRAHAAGDASKHYPGHGATRNSIIPLALSVDNTH
jgi:hypothetical protein